MPSLPDGIFIFILALLLLGPKKLPKLARELGKWVGEFRRASNEFKMQMEEEMRLVDQSDRQKEIAAIEAAAPATAPLPGVPTHEPEHPHLPAAEAALEAAYAAPEPLPPTDLATPSALQATTEICHPERSEGPASPTTEASTAVTTPLPIATAGDLHLMPPATGLPTARNSSVNSIFDSIPATTEKPESPVHG